LAVVSPSFNQKVDKLQSIYLMDVRQAIYAFTDQAKDLLVLLRSPQAKALSRGDLDTLEVQLYLLEKK